MAARMDSALLQVLIARHVGIQRNLVVPNVSHSFFPFWEVDVLALSGAGYATEFEIKVSIGDLKREWRKARWLLPYRGGVHHELIRKYVIVVLDSIAEKAKAHIPDHIGAGLLSFGEKPSSWDRNTMIYVPTEHIKPEINRAARKWSDSERQHLAQIAALRVWHDKRKAVGVGYF